MSYWKLYYHFVWGTKNRLPLIDSALEPQLYRAIAAKAFEMGGIVHAVGGVDDHIHLAVSIPPKIAPAKFIGDVKGNSSHYINHVVKPDFEFHWQDTYGVFSFGEKNLSAVVRYIHQQKKHHAERAKSVGSTNRNGKMPKRKTTSLKIYLVHWAFTSPSHRGVINHPATFTNSAKAD